MDQFAAVLSREYDARLVSGRAQFIPDTSTTSPSNLPVVGNHAWDPVEARDVDGPVLKRNVDLPQACSVYCVQCVVLLALHTAPELDPDPFANPCTLDMYSADAVRPDT
jgi:hypothetical protein